jgi:hypothetical protein
MRFPALQPTETAFTAHPALTTNRSGNGCWKQPFHLYRIYFSQEHGEGIILPSNCFGTCRADHHITVFTRSRCRDPITEHDIRRPSCGPTSSKIANTVSVTAERFSLVFCIPVAGGSGRSATSSEALRRQTPTSALATSRSPGMTSSPHLDPPIPIRCRIRAMNAKGCGPGSSSPTATAVAEVHVPRRFR